MTTHKWIEVDFDEFTEYDEDGIKTLALPEDLPFDESTCAWCDMIIGAFLDERDERAGMEIAPTFVCNGCGLYACEACAKEDDHVLQG